MKPIGMFLVVVSLTVPCAADDWPQWLGSQRDGGTREAVAPWKIPPRVLWRHPAGAGYSSPVVAENTVFLHARVKDKQEEEILAFDATTGKPRWREAYVRPRYVSVLSTGPRATPAIAAGRLYTNGINGLLTCCDAKTGKRLWQVDAYKRMGASLPRYGVCCSPLVIGDCVVVSVGGKGSSVVAFDTNTGEIRWQALDDSASTSSPILFASPNQSLPDLVVMTNLRLAALNPLDGTLNWEFPLVFQPSGAAPTPLSSGDSIVTSTMTNGSTAVRIANTNAKTSAARAWQAKDLGGYFSSGVIAKGDNLFLITNVLQPLPIATLRCVNLQTGKERWKKDGIGYFHAGLIRTGDNKLLVLDDGGILKLLDFDEKASHELCRAKVCGGTLVNPALADGRVYVRDDKELICLQLAP